MVVLTYTPMHQIVVYLTIYTSHAHFIQENHNSWNSKLQHFSTIYSLFVIVRTPFNLLITEKEEEFQDSDAS